MPNNDLSYWGIDETVSLLDLKKKQKRDFGYLYRGIKQYTSKGSILDVGCGTGLFLEKYKEDGWDELGIELSEKAASYAKNKLKVRCLTGDIEKLKLPEKLFEVIVLNNVLEHLNKPAPTLKRLSKHLVKGGLMCLVTPNTDSLGFSIFGSKWYHLDPDRHVNLFSEKQLKRLLFKNNLKIISVKHNYWLHNYVGFFESFRRLYSPRFQVKAKGKEQIKPKPFSRFLKEAGKVFFKVLSFLLTLWGIIIKRGEVICLYAKKD